MEPSNRALRQKISQLYLPALEKIVKQIQAGIVQLYRDNHNRLTPQWDFADAHMSIAEKCFITVFQSQAWGTEDEAIKRAALFLGVTVDFLRTAYKTGEALDVRCNGQIVEGAKMMNKLIEDLNAEAEKERTRKRRLTVPGEEGRKNDGLPAD